MLRFSPRPRAQREQSLCPMAQLVTFEAFRDLVKLLQLGVADETGIALAEEENIELRAQAQSAAAAEAGVKAPVGPPLPFSAPAGEAMQIYHRFHS